MSLLINHGRVPNVIKLINLLNLPKEMIVLIKDFIYFDIFLSKTFKKMVLLKTKLSLHINPVIIIPSFIGIWTGCGKEKFVWDFENNKLNFYFIPCRLCGNYKQCLTLKENIFYKIKCHCK